MELYGSIKKEVLEQLYSFCAYQERCKQDVVKKLLKLEIPTKYHQEYIGHLEEERFLDEARFVEAFVKGKLNGNKWGKRKIAFSLRQKSIPQQLIDEVFENIQQGAYHETAKQLGVKKWTSIKEENPWKKKQKLYAYLAQKGFEQDVITKVIEELSR